MDFFRLTSCRKHEHNPYEIRTWFIDFFFFFPQYGLRFLLVNIIWLIWSTFESNESFWPEQNRAILIVQFWQAKYRVAFLSSRTIMQKGQNTVWEQHEIRGCVCSLRGRDGNPCRIQLRLFCFHIVGDQWHEFSSVWVNRRSCQTGVMLLHQHGDVQGFYITAAPSSSVCSLCSMKILSLFTGFTCRGWCFYRA